MAKSSHDHKAVPSRGARILPFTTDPEDASRQADVIVNLDGEEPGMELDYLPVRANGRSGGAFATVAKYVGVGLVCFGLGFGVRQMTGPHGAMAVVAATPAPP